MNRGRRQTAQVALEQRVQQFMTRRLTTVPDDALWEEARRRESETLHELRAVSSFQAMDEQGASVRVVRGMRYSLTGTPRRRTRIELSGEYVPMDMSQSETIGFRN